MSDVTGDGKLDEEEFIVAMHLIGVRLQTGVVPDSPSHVETTAPANINPPTTNVPVVADPNTSSISIPEPEDSVPPTSVEWHLSPEERTKYSAFFKYATETTKATLVEKEQVKPFFLKSGIAPQELAKIW